MPPDVDLMSNLFSNQMQAAGHVCTMRRLGIGDFGEGVELETTAGRRNAIIQFWSGGTDGKGLVSYLVIDDREAELVEPEVWLSLDGDPGALVDTVCRAVVLQLRDPSLSAGEF